MNRKENDGQTNQPVVTDADIAQAKAAGFTVHNGEQDYPDVELRGRWWWVVGQRGWSGYECAESNFAEEREAWADAVRTLRNNPELKGIVPVDVVIPARDPKFAAELSFTAAMRVDRLGQAIKAWRVADDSPEDAGSGTEPDEHAVVCLLADLRHYCDAHGLDFALLDRGACADYLEQLANDRHHEKERLSALSRS